jgi:hypothetical protein
LFWIEGSSWQEDFDKTLAAVSGRANPPPRVENNTINVTVFRIQKNQAHAPRKHTKVGNDLFTTTKSGNFSACCTSNALRCECYLNVLY